MGARRVPTSSLLCLLFASPAYGFQLPQSGAPSTRPRRRSAAAVVSRLRSSPSPSAGGADDDATRQWDLLNEHHLGTWSGTWTTYDYMGDVADTIRADVLLGGDGGGGSNGAVSHTHQLHVGAVRSDCDTCHDASATKILPLRPFRRADMGKTRLASTGMAVGPTVLRSGAMSTEIGLKHGDGRLRAVFMHAPVWEKGVEPGSCPPQGLKLFRMTICREAKRPSAPTPDSEGASPPPAGDPTFFRPVPPFAWHKKWSGTSWTWGPQTGDQGWAITDMEEGDAWHGRPRGDVDSVWSMRLGGGVLVQAPKLLAPGRSELFRLAWMPEEGRLSRIEGSVVAMGEEEDGDGTVRYAPPVLGSLRCDTLEMTGELEGTSKLEFLKTLDNEKAELRP